MYRPLERAVLAVSCLLAACNGTPADPAIDPTPEPAPDPVQVDGRTFLGEYPIRADFAEGGVYDPEGHAFFVGSLATGAVYRVDAATGRQTTVFEPDEPGVWSTLGMDLDAFDNRLWVCAMDDRRGLGEAHDFAGHLWGIDLATGRRAIERPLGNAAEGGTCSDVAAARDGAVYVNDRDNPRVYMYADGQLELLVEDAALTGRAGGQSALVMTPDQGALLSLVYRPARLVRVDLDDLSVSVVDIDGPFSDDAGVDFGADGIALDGEGGALVAFTSQLNRLVPASPAWRGARSTTVNVEGGLTDVIATPAGPYLLNGQSLAFTAGDDPRPARLRRFDGEL